MKSLFLGLGLFTLVAGAACSGEDDSFSSTGGGSNAGKGGSAKAGATGSGGSAGTGSGGKGGSAGKSSGGSGGTGGSSSGGSAGCADDCCGDDCGNGGVPNGTGGSDTGGAGVGGSGAGSGSSGAGSGSSGAGDGGSAGAAVGAAPTATINHPGDGEVRSAGDDIPFIGVGVDLEDGALLGAALVWTSSLAGEIGTGASFDAALEAGMHVVTLTVTDSDGNEGTDAITLEIQ